VPQILAAIDYDLENTVFSFIPNTAEVAFMGMLEGLNDYLDEEKCRAIEKLDNKDAAAVSKIISRRVRTEKVAIKDIKLRTFISESGERDQLANHVYDITYGSIRPKTDNLVVIDDSIVRGTTLRQSIITILARLNPRRMVIVSSAPQIRYPDFYGIDMSNIGDLIAFRAALELCRDGVCRDGAHPVSAEEIYQKCVAQQALPEERMINYATEIYKPFSDAEISKKIVELITPEEVTCPVELIFQQRETLSEICRNNGGDWYFTGNYPTKGGMKRMNDTLLEYIRYNLL
jgi:amidophosphoribosyltransferase